MKAPDRALQLARTIAEGHPDPATATLDELWRFQDQIVAEVRNLFNPTPDHTLAARREIADRIIALAPNKLSEGIRLFRENPDPHLLAKARQRGSKDPLPSPVTLRRWVDAAYPDHTVDRRAQMDAAIHYNTKPGWLMRKFGISRSYAEALIRERRLAKRAQEARTAS